MVEAYLTNPSLTASVSRMEIDADGVGDELDGSLICNICAWRRFDPETSGFQSIKGDTPCVISIEDWLVDFCAI